MMCSVYLTYTLLHNLLSICFAQHELLNRTFNIGTGKVELDYKPARDSALAARPVTTIPTPGPV